jgi:hypothetical protein
MEYPIKAIDDDTFVGLDIASDDKGLFTVVLKDHVQMVSHDDLISEMRDQLDIRGAVRKALLRKANKALMAGLKKSRLRLNEEQQETFDLNFLIWFADKTINGEHQAYLAK